MAKTYTAKLKISFQKQHTCVGCQSEFRYQLDRQVTGTGGSKEAAESNLQTAISKSLANDVDQHACPHCGMMQPDMIAAVRSSRALTGACIGAIAVAVGLIIALPHWVTLSTSAMISAIGMAILMLVWLSSVFFNPNSNMTRGQSASAEKVAAGTVQIVAQGNVQDSVDDFSSPSSGQWFTLLLGATSLVLVASPMVLPSIMGWKTNDCYPPVVGPGDTTTIYFDQQIRSLKGYWNGWVQAAATVEGEQTIVPMQAETKKSTWGDTISGKSVSNNSNAMYAKVTVPADETLVGKSLNLELKVQANYPLAEGREFFEHQEEFQHRANLQLSAAGSGSQYFNAWLIGQISALASCLIGGFVLSSSARSLAARAIAPKLIMPDDAEDVEEVE